MYLSTPSRSGSGSSARPIFKLPWWVRKNIPSRGMGQFDPISASIGAGLNVASAIAGYMLQSAAQRDDTTNIVNFAATELNQNSQAYNSCQISSAEAQSNFMQIWAWVVQQCSNPAFGTAGGSCVQERQAGGSIDWFKLYYDTYSNPPGPNNYVGAAGYPPTTAGCSYSGASASVLGGSTASAAGCFSLLTPFGIPDPCIAGIPIGLGTAAGIAILLAVLL
jgi:hypothetical protein